MSRARRYTASVLLLGFVTVLGPRTASATSIKVAPSTTNVSQGQQFGVDLAMENVADLYAFQVSVVFDPAILQALPAIEGPFLGLGGGTFFFDGAIDNAAGTISFLIGTLIGMTPGVSGTGNVATLRFSAIAPGTSLVSVVLDAANGDVLLDSSFGEISAPALSGSVAVTPSVTAVPEPATLSLVLLGLAAAARRKRTRAV